MSKRLTIHFNNTVELPGSAEIVPFKDEDGATSDHIRIGAHLFRPYVAWMEYKSTAMMKKHLPGTAGGQGWIDADSDIVNEHLMPVDETWFIDNTPN